MERKDCSDCGYFSPDFCRGMPGGRIESFEVITALQRNPRVQGKFVSFRSFWPRYGKSKRKLFSNGKSKGPLLGKVALKSLYFI